MERTRYSPLPWEGSGRWVPFGRALLVYQRGMDRVSEGLGWLAKWLIPVCVAVGFTNVLLRYIGRWQGRTLTSNRWVEAQWMLFGAIFLLAFPYILKHNVNVRVDFWFQNFSRKRQALIDFVGHLVALVPYCLFALWVNWDYALRSLYRRATAGGPGRCGTSGSSQATPAASPGLPSRCSILVGLRLPAAPDPGRTGQARLRPDREGRPGRARGAR